MRHCKWACLVLMCALSIFWVTEAVAQNVTPKSDPSRLHLRYEKNSAIPKLVSPRGDIELRQVDAATPPPGSEKINFRLAGVEIFNSTVYSKKDFEPLYDNLRRKKVVSLADMYDLANAITKKYVDDGYFRSSAKIAEQKHDDLNNVNFIIGIQEGRIDRVTFVEDVSLSKDAYTLKMPDETGEVLLESDLKQAEKLATRNSFELKGGQGQGQEKSEYAEGPKQKGLVVVKAKTLRNKVEFVGDFPRKYFLGIIARKLMALSRNKKPLKLSDYNYYTQILAELPGIEITPSFIAADGKYGIKPRDKGVSDQNLSMMHLVIGVKKSKALEASVSIDNRGTKTIGPYQIQGSMSFNSLLGHYEQINVSGVITPDTKELKYASFSLKETANSEGTKLTYSGNISRSTPGDTLTVLEVESRSTNFSISAEHPLIRSRGKPRKHDFDVNAGLSFKHSRTDQLGSKTSEDRLRIIDAGVRYETEMDNSKTTFQASVFHGLPFLNSTKESDPFKSRSDGKISFTRYTASAYNSDYYDVAKSGEYVQIIAQASGQWSKNGLLSSQEFGVGGAPYGRAYDSSEITGDYGWSGSLEARYHLPTYGKKIHKNDFVNHGLAGLNSKELKNRGSSYIYGFYDGGVVYQITAINEPTKSSLASAGAGFGFTILDTVDGKLEISKPLTRPVANATGDGKAPRFFFQLSSRL